MPDLRYVCLSDTHLGARESVLTNVRPDSGELDTTEASPAMRGLVECLRALVAANSRGGRPTLVLNGDVLELALATDDQAAMVFQRFLELVLPEGDPLFDDVVYVPGNHDHHVWESARESQYADFLDRLPLRKPLPPPWHTTKVFMLDEPTVVPAFFPTRLARRYPHLRDLVIRTAYPNFGVKSADGSRCVLFHHGHFTEPIYWLMSTLKTMLFPDQPMPTAIWDLEAENYAWIDWFWSTLGRSGQAGRDVALVYARLQDPNRLGAMLERLADGLAERWARTRVGERVEAAVLKPLLRFLGERLAGTERGDDAAVLSEASEAGLAWYANVPLRHQVLDELRIAELPPDVALAFGHTHKPFQRDVRFQRYPRPVHLYNSGGWTVDGVEPQGAHGGAVVLVDEALHATSLRMYDEARDRAGYRVTVEESLGDSAFLNPLTLRVRQLVDAERDPWRAFSATVAEEVEVRRRHLRTRIAASG